MPKNPEPGPDQESLFDLAPQREYSPGSITPWQERSDTPVEFRGVAVDVGKRAILLARALGNFGRVNQRRGLDFAVESPVHSPKIYKRYGHETEERVQRAQVNADEMLAQARRDFSEAGGFAELHESDAMDPDLVTPLESHLWGEFKKKYANPDKRKARDDYIKRLNKHLDSK